MYIISVESLPVLLEVLDEQPRQNLVLDAQALKVLEGLLLLAESKSESGLIEHAGCVVRPFLSVHHRAEEIVIELVVKSRIEGFLSKE